MADDVAYMTDEQWADRVAGLLSRVDFTVSWAANEVAGLVDQLRSADAPVLADGLQESVFDRFETMRGFIEEVKLQFEWSAGLVKRPSAGLRVVE
jgi:hypothetical protein